MLPSQNSLVVAIWILQTHQTLSFPLFPRDGYTNIAVMGSIPAALTKASISFCSGIQVLASSSKMVAIRAVTKIENHCHPQAKTQTFLQPACNAPPPLSWSKKLNAKRKRAGSLVMHSWELERNYLVASASQSKLLLSNMNRNTVRNRFKKNLLEKRQQTISFLSRKPLPRHLHHCNNHLQKDCYYELSLATNMLNFANNLKEL